MAAGRKNRQTSKTRGAWKLKAELSPVQVGLLLAGLTTALFVMFVFGVLVGRGLPPTDGADSGLTSQLAEFFGLRTKASKPAEHASRTWQSPEKILGELTYHEDLTQGQAPRLSDADRQAKQALAAGPSPPAQAVQPEPESYFTLMVSSLRNSAFAKDLVEQLRNKGYSPKLEAVQMEGGGTWYRVLVGQFEKRSDAQAFAARFNRKEKMKALVIRVTP